MTSFRLSEAQSGLRAQFMLGREQLRIGQDSAPILRFFASKGDEKEGMDETRQSSREEGSSRGEEAAQTGGERSHGSGSSGSRTETGSQAETSYQKVVSSIPKALRGLASEIKAVLMPQDKYELQSHAIERDDRPPADPNAPTDLVVSKTKHEVPRWRQYMDELRQQATGHEAVQRVVKRIQDKREELQDRWETSDSAVVERINALAEDLLSDSTRATAMREVCARDPGFDLPSFLRGIRDQVRVFEKANAEGDVDTLRKMCSEELVGRLSERFKALRASDLYLDSRVLNTYEVEMIAMDMVDNDPAMVVDVRVQRVNCVRDKFGNVVQGSEDQIVTLFYFWELRQEQSGYTNKSGVWVPPRWQITDHVQRPEVLLLSY